MMLGESGYQDEDEDALLDNIIRRRPDGIVLTRIVRSEASRARLRESRITVVESWDWTPNPIDMLIGFSHTDVGLEVARSLGSNPLAISFLGPGSGRGGCVPLGAGDMELLLGRRKVLLKLLTARNVAVCPCDTATDA